MNELSPEQIVTIARIAHEANRAWCILHGDTSQAHWEDAADWQQESAVAGIRLALAGSTPEQQHVAWMNDKIAAGWVYGAVKDAAAKTHPCLVPYPELPPEQRAKDVLYIGIVRAVAATFAHGMET